MRQLDPIEIVKSKSAPEEERKEEKVNEKGTRSSNNSPSKDTQNAVARMSIRPSSISSNAGDDSLIALINSEFFTVHMLFQHLLKSMNESKMNIVDHIINVKLGTQTIECLDFYLPQLW